MLFELQMEKLSMSAKEKQIKELLLSNTIITMERTKAGLSNLFDYEIIKS